MTDATTPILHHYDRSPFAEKARILLGIKGLDWGSVDIPMMMPKPDLMPLTGGYRKTPVMQIGADIYCDTQLITDVLEARQPDPGFYPDDNRGAAMGMLRWSESAFFRASVGSVFGTIIETLPPEFLKDRSEFGGAPLDVDMVKAAQPHSIAQWRAFTGWVDAQLADGRDFFFGDAPGAVDASLYMHVWFVSAVLSAELTGIGVFRHVQPWAARVGAIKHGNPSPLPSSNALDIAQSADPRETEGTVAGRFSSGDTVTVTPDDNGRVPVAGRLVRADDGRITVLRTDDRVGDVAVHFPRAGFIIAPAG
ncbi:glutathione S-transferase family protein [Parasphingopyxis algicola]|uniref:glutathione S-transferase family protein n=1 Tax=Parasphingopyxis algicola TaxID=2026624 RepID=UPI00159FB31C|nr:glutathione S-transferase family protein [Parasphingopyxis algicola]QLC24183.1 glutathione S-transferase family protein [Parasphingopyxis algicola]